MQRGQSREARLVEPNEVRMMFLVNLVPDNRLCRAKVKHRVSNVANTKGGCKKGSNGGGDGSNWNFNNLGSREAGYRDNVFQDNWKFGLGVGLGGGGLNGLRELDGAEGDIDEHTSVAIERVAPATEALAL